MDEYAEEKRTKSNYYYHHHHHHHHHHHIFNEKLTKLNSVQYEGKISLK